MNLFTPTHVANVALDWCAAQETRDALLCSMDGGQAVVAQLRLEGYTWKEVAHAFGVSQWTPQTWMASAAVTAYNECPELRDALREYVKLCPYCGKAIAKDNEQCRDCYRKIKTVTQQRYCMDCGVPITRQARRCMPCYEAQDRGD